MTMVHGFCPMGCGETLLLAEGCVTCSYAACPQPLAVHQILQDRETEHVLQINERDFSVLHPLRERVGHQLLDCEVDGRLAVLAGPPVDPGRYRLHIVDGSWSWQQIGGGS